MNAMLLLLWRLAWIAFMLWLLRDESWAVIFVVGGLLLDVAALRLVERR